MQHYIVTIHGAGFSDVEEIELPGLPADGEPLETKYGTCVVTSTEALEGHDRFDGRIACALP
jgi:hypothetical protein